MDLKGNARVPWQFKGQGGNIWGIPSPDGRYLAILGEATIATCGCWKGSKNSNE